MQRKHIATHGHKGWAGNRLGTRYLYTFEEAHAAQDQPWFRWKNDERRKAYYIWLSQGEAGVAGPSSASAPCPHTPTYDAGLCCGHPDDCTFVSPAALAPIGEAGR